MKPIRCAFTGRNHRSIKYGHTGIFALFWVTEKRCQQAFLPDGSMFPIIVTRKDIYIP